VTHILLHFIVPAVAVGLLCSRKSFRKEWKTAYLIMMVTMIVDVDHLLATPIYMANRCSIGFHPLHQFIPIALYAVACFIPKLRYAGIGLMIHMLLDSIDCQVTNGVWFV